MMIRKSPKAFGSTNVIPEFEGGEKFMLQLEESTPSDVGDEKKEKWLLIPKEQEESRFLGIQNPASSGKEETLRFASGTLRCYSNAYMIEKGHDFEAMDEVIKSFKPVHPCHAVNHFPIEINVKKKKSDGSHGTNAASSLVQGIVDFATNAANMCFIVILFLVSSPFFTSACSYNNSAERNPPQGNEVSGAPIAIPPPVLVGVALVVGLLALGRHLAIKERESPTGEGKRKDEEEREDCEKGEWSG